MARRAEHLSAACRYRRQILDWRTIAGAYVGLIDLREGLPVHLASGLRFDISHPSDAWTLLQVLCRNDYRVRAREPWRTVIDIGANLGTFAVRAAHAAPLAHIHCYEPSPDTCKLLRRNVVANGVSARISIHQQAVSGVPGPARLRVTGPSCMRRLVPNDTPPEACVKVESVTLEHIFLTQHIHSCDLLKMDCEGAEYEIFRACPPAILSRVQAVVLEYHNPDSPEHIELIDILRANGFSVECVSDRLARTGYLFGEKEK